MKQDVTGYQRRGCLALFLALVLLAGCATQRAGYDKPGATEAEQKRDQSAGVKASLSSG